MDGERLSELRKDRRITQKELAEKLSVSENTISCYERNLTTPDDEMKIMIAKFFNVSLDYLMGTSDTPAPLGENKSQLIYFEQISSGAEREITNFLQYIKDKYTK